VKIAQFRGISRKTAHADFKESRSFHHITVRVTAAKWRNKLDPRCNVHVWFNIEKEN